MVTWFTAVQRGSAGLRDLPSRPPHQTDMNTRLTLTAELRGIIEYTLPVGFVPVPCGGASSTDEWLDGADLGKRSST
jgi:hypothetical protein